jgi:hypothetical protein
MVAKTSMSTARRIAGMLASAVAVSWASDTGAIGSFIVPPPMVMGDPAAPQVPPTPLGFVWATLLGSDPKLPVAVWP